MSKKTISYDIAKSFVKDKDKAINTFIETSLDKTQQIFVYANMPETLPSGEVENLLQTNGHCIIAEHDGNLYAFSGGFSGENDVYNNPRFYTVSNVALKLSKTFEIGVDCVLVKNDYKCLGLMPVIQKYGVLLLDSELSLNTAAILSRITMLISAPDDKTKASADLFIQKILDGDFSIIGENGFFDGIRLQTAGVANANYITQLVELIQYYKASFLNEIGLQANFNMKRERLIESEVAMNVDSLLPFIDNMFAERVKAFSKVNEMFGTEIVVDYNSVWKVTHEHSDNEVETVETDTCENEVEATTANGQATEVNEVETVETEETDETEETTENEVETVETDETEETDGNEVETDETEETEETEEKKKGGKGNEAD